MDITRYSSDQVVLDETQVHEIGDQIYLFPFLAPDYCRDLVRVAEEVGAWETEEQVDLYGPKIHGGSYDGIPRKAREQVSKLNDKSFGTLETLTEEDEVAKNGMSLMKIPGVYEAYGELCRRHIIPFAQRLWASYRVKRQRAPYIIKYDADNEHLPKNMELHWDQCVLSLVTYLNSDFRGGGTYFPKWKSVSGHKGPGWAAMYPGGISHQHLALPISRGRRYLLLSDFF